MISRQRSIHTGGEVVSLPKSRRRAAARLFTAAAGALALASCDGSNLFVEGPPGPTGEDVTAPSVDIQLPASGATTVAAADSVFVRARAADNRALDSLVFEGFALRGDPALGTQTRAERYGRKSVRFGAGVSDTTITRYLLATADSSIEQNVRVVVTAFDTAGNAAADTSLVNIGGPRITILAPLPPDTTFRGGTQIPVRLQAEDRVDQIRSVRLRATGAFTFDTTLTYVAAREQVDTTVVIPIPSVQGTLRLEATAVSGSNITGTGRPVDLLITAPAQDNTAPRVMFTAAFPARAEPDDSVLVVVSASDETRVDSVGVTVLAIRRRAGSAPETLGVLHRRTAGALDSVRFSLAAVRLSGLDTATVDLEVTAYAVDPNRNCGAAVSPGTPQQLPCQAGPEGSRVAAVPGRLFSTFFARGLTTARPAPGDVIADLVADDRRLYLSNLSQNRVEILPLGATSYAAPVRVGSEPWGLAINRSRDTLYVANSGGTNISAVSIGGTPVEVDASRIFTRNEVLFDVEFAVDNTTGIAAPSRVTRVDYSDRPQFIAQAANGLLVYSTRPTGAAPDGTVRIYDPRKQTSEIFIGYVDRTTATRAIVVNAADAGLVVGRPNRLSVCARRRLGDSFDGPCFVGGVDQVSRSLDSLRSTPANGQGVRYDTRVDLFRLIDDVGFRDTTFVGVSGDRRYVAVGEGAAERARVPMFHAEADSLRLVGDVRDLISNADERVIGLGINRDGSLGVARGRQAYFFDPELRLQGVTPSGSPSGGVAMFPESFGYPGNRDNRLAFVSGLDEGGAPYIDVIDTFNFSRISRIYLRDPVVGALAVAPRVATDPANVALRLYAITSGGVVGVAVTTADLTR